MSRAVTLRKTKGRNNKLKEVSMLRGRSRYQYSGQCFEEDAFEVVFRVPYTILSLPFEFRWRYAIRGPAFDWEVCHTVLPEHKRQNPVLNVDCTHTGYQSCVLAGRGVTYFGRCSEKSTGRPKRDPGTKTAANEALIKVSPCWYNAHS
jgi:hypothetical protein